MKTRTSWFIKLWDSDTPATFGLGECAPLEHLSVETPEEIESLLLGLQANINNKNIALPSSEHLTLRQLHDFLANSKLVPSVSSICFAMETALLDLLNGGTRRLFKTDFIKGKPIPINGLVWIGKIDDMLRQVDKKIGDGFRCIKIKIGSLNFEQEYEVLQHIRRKYRSGKIVIRLDANGAFTPDEAMFKLKELSQFEIHSIEQPLQAKSKETALLCRQSPIAVALDEELIGVTNLTEKKTLLNTLHPSYIILKPSLHGGLLGCQEWIALAAELNIGWWITSALESSIGLNAIAQFTSTYPIVLPQGLGTGQIYEDNIESPLIVKNGQLIYDHLGSWDLAALEDERT